MYQFWSFWHYGFKFVSWLIRMLYAKEFENIDRRVVGGIQYLHQYDVDVLSIFARLPLCIIHHGCQFTHYSNFKDSDHQFTRNKSKLNRI